MVAQRRAVKTVAAYQFFGISEHQAIPVCFYNRGWPSLVDTIIFYTCNLSLRAYGGFYCALLAKLRRFFLRYNSRGRYFYFRYRPSRHVTCSRVRHGQPLPPWLPRDTVVNMTARRGMQRMLPAGKLIVGP